MEQLNYEMNPQPWFNENNQTSKISDRTTVQTNHHHHLHQQELTPINHKPKVDKSKIKKHVFGEKSDRSSSLPLFFIYGGRMYQNKPLLWCRHESEELWAWEEGLKETTQNTGTMWLLEALRYHPQRTKHPGIAQLFIIPFDTYLSYPSQLEQLKISSQPRLEPRCEVENEKLFFESNHFIHSSSSSSSLEEDEDSEIRKDDHEKMVAQKRPKQSSLPPTHTKRVDAVLNQLKSSRFWKAKHGKDHLIISPWYGTARSLGGPGLPSTAKWWLQSPPDPKETLWSFLSNNSILATTDEFFAKNWNHVITIPYVHHAGIPFIHPSSLLDQEKTTKQGNVKENQCESLLKPSSKMPGNQISFYFRGSFKHGLNCKRNEFGNQTIRELMFTIFHRDSNAVIINTDEDMVKLQSSHEETKSIRRNLLKKQLQQHHHKAKGAKPSHYLPPISPQHSNDDDHGHGKVTSRPYHRDDYVTEMLRAKFCLCPRGDTTTSRRLFDAIAAGCIPILIADNMHLPFRDIIDYDSFTVTIFEKDLIEKEDILLSEILSLDIEQKQIALYQVRRDLLYGYGSPYSPFSPLSSRQDSVDQQRNCALSYDDFQSRVADHLLQKAFAMSASSLSLDRRSSNRNREFVDTFAKCEEPKTQEQRVYHN